MTRVPRALASVLAGVAPAAPKAQPPKPPHSQPHKPQRPDVRAYLKGHKHDLAPAIADAAQRWKLDPFVIHALIHKESRGNPRARSHKGARGVAQFVPSGAAAVGRLQKRRGVPAKDAFTYARTLDPVASIHAAAELLAYLLDTCGELVEAVGAYNAGKCTNSAFARAVLRLARALRLAAGILEARS